MQPSSPCEGGEQSMMDFLLVRLQCWFVYLPAALSLPFLWLQQQRVQPSATPVVTPAACLTRRSTFLAPSPRLPRRFPASSWTR